MKFYFVVTTIICAFFVFPCDANSQKHINYMTEIMRKICNITKNTLKNASVSDRPEHFKKIKKKLLKATQRLGVTDDVYVGVIMEGIKKMADRNDYSLCEDNNTTVPQNTSTHNSLRTQENVFSSLLTNENTAKNSKKIRLIKEIVNKIDYIVHTSFKNARTSKEKNYIMEKLKKKIEKAIEKRRDSRTGISNITHSDIILDGIKLFMNNNETRRETLKIIEDFELKNENKQSLDKNDILMDSHKTTSLPLTTAVDCNNAKKNICLMLKNLDEFICTYDDTVLPLTRVCDGFVDCPDGSDERNCVDFANEWVRDANSVMQLLDASKFCHAQLVDETVYASHDILMTKLLENQIRFLNDYTNTFPHANQKVKIDVKNILIQGSTIAEITNEISIILHAFVNGFESLLCSNLTNDFKKLFQKFHDGPVSRADKSDKESKPNALKYCTCDGQLCTNMTTCSASCKRVCYQKYTLKRWLCNSIEKENSISLSQMCDGKLDCYDESDEDDCVIYSSVVKFEANKYFQSALSLIKNRLAFKDYQNIQQNLARLHEGITSLRKLSLNVGHPELNLILIRDTCFDLLVTIYNDFLDVPVLDKKAEDTYELLGSIKDKLINGLKRSDMGNKQVVPPDGCFCKGAVCVTPKCSKKCIRVCAAKPNLTRFICYKSNTTVSTDVICNGRKNCPENEDEIDCKKDMCRVHHIVVLRHSLQNVPEKDVGTALGEVLNLWKAKVVAQLSVAEKRGRHTPLELRDLVNDILDDLLISYTSLEDYKKINNEQVLKKFTELAQHVIDVIKSCGL